MGEALVSGLIRSGGRTADEIMVTCRREERARELAGKLRGHRDARQPGGGARGPTTLVLTVKPQDMEALLAQIREHVTPDAPGDQLRGRRSGPRSSRSTCRTACPVVRVMSNVPVLVDEAMSVVSSGSTRRATSTWRSPRSSSASVGRVIRLPEKHQDAITATSGAGPAYFFLLAEAMIEACILLGPVAGRGDRADHPDDARVGEDAARHRQAPGGAARDGDLAGRDDDRGDPSPRGGGGAGGVPERDRRRAPTDRSSWRRAATTTTSRPVPTRRRRTRMGRGSLAKVRSAKDRQRKKKAREVRQAADRAAARKAAKKKR